MSRCEPILIAIARKEAWNLSLKKAVIVCDVTGSAILKEPELLNINPSSRELNAQLVVI